MEFMLLEHQMDSSTQTETKSDDHFHVQLQARAKRHRGDQSTEWIGSPPVDTNTY